MGIFYYVRSVALAEDLPLEEKEITDINEFYAEVETAYTRVCNAYVNDNSNSKK